MIPAGTFLMGATDLSWATPVHPVTFTSAFEMDKYEVTVAAYQACEDAGWLGCTPPAILDDCNSGVLGRELYPINCIDWNQTKAYCNWVGKRLCSESEWEYAARGSEGRLYPWGNEIATCEYAVMDDGSGDGCGTGLAWQVGSKAAGATPEGVMDMAGNMLEWVEDDYHETYADAPANGNPWIDIPRASMRMLRGGGFFDGDSYQRSSGRNTAAGPSGIIGFHIGGRCCRSL